ncbi:nitroreductase family deazaflavin-dependent oxidoreductase [Candidatus Frankia nodulisporulans]|uniref:nitroreductase family deazaflavin-dependent oxidoreductase n=1 Tax=Candidatus Frankia nodulisporulans TaxID=2060052 RepID=UPI0013D08BC4|nr:nitroreductase family deazaflavin-dependent oxidoreductase [Candidatus Frankia nodulisporulans]
MTTAEPGYTAPDATLLGAEHVARYRETNGEVGYIWNGVTILLLTTTGRKSGQPRTTPLIFAKDGDDFLVVASQGGAPTHPLWFLNLEADPKAEVQVLDKTIPVLGRAASEQEKPRLWEIVSAAWPNYHVYQTRTTRPIPVVVLTPRG